MGLLRDLRERLRAIVFRGRMESELEEELRFHLENEAAARRRAGSPDPDREARLALGSIELIKEDVRDARGVRPLEDFVADARFALRTLRRNPGFAVAVILVLGVAIGAATSVYVVADRVLFAPFPFRDSERLVRVDQRYGSGFTGTISAVDIQAVTEQARSLEAFGAVRYADMSLSGVGDPEHATVGRATAGFFRALDVGPAIGRLIDRSDEAPGAPPVAVLTHAHAERLFGSAQRAVGGSVTLDGRSHTVIGILPADRPSLAGPRVALWTALQLGTPERRGPFGFRGVGRLAEGVTLAQAERDLADLSVRIFPLWSSGFQDSTARLVPVPLRQALVGHAKSQVALFSGGVLLVLLAAVANVATLLLVRASAREHEFAVRVSLGAGRGRLARLVITECLVLTALAAVVATVVAAFGVRIAPLAAPNLPRISQAELSGAAIAFALALSLVCGLLVSLAPLSIASASGSAAAARLAGSGGARTGSGPRAARARAALVVAEFALAFPLLVGAALLFASFLRLERRELGFEPAGLYALNVSLTGDRYSNDTTRLELWRRLEARASEASGVTAAGLSGSLPPDNFGDVNNFNLIDKPVPAGTAEPVAPWPPVTNGYFAALGIQLLEGRLFTPGDTAGAPPVAVVSRTWAEKYYARESAVGKQMIGGGCTSCPPITVAGVVSDVQYRGLTGEADAVYVPLAQQPPGGLFVVVRSQLGPAATIRALRGALADVEPTVAPIEVSLAERVHDALGDPRRWTIVIGAFASVGLLLAALGIFGLMSYVVRRRRRELGIRLALGASPASLTRLVVRSGMFFAAIGTAIGLALSVLQSRWLESLLYGVDAIDGLALGLAALAMLAVAAVACWVPGLAAARVRPVEALSST
jgi:predicted permease